MGYTQKVVIIGAGISGLACAFRLKQLGVQSLLLEASDHPGGMIATIRRDGHLFELGAQSPRFPASVWGLLRDLHLDQEFVAGDAKARRYILRNGKLRRAPFSPGGLIATDLLRGSSKLRILSEIFRFSRPPAEEETLAAFVERKFGKDVLVNLVDPVVSTVFFADACKMGMESAFPALVNWERSHGSVARGAIRARAKNKRTSMKVTDSLPSLGTLRPGMGRLPERLAEEMGPHIRYGARVTSIVRGKASWEVVLSHGEHFFAEHVVLALPADEAAKALDTSVPPLAMEFRKIAYEAICVVSGGYERRKVKNPLDGFGFMVPRSEGLRTISTFWNSSQFPERAPDGRVLITSFARCGEIRDMDALEGIVAAENAAILGITGEPEVRNFWQHPRALPQYNVGHRRVVGAIQEALGGAPNLHVAGNYLEGRAIGDCVDLAQRVAEKVHSRLQAANIKAVGVNLKE